MRLQCGRIHVLGAINHQLSAIVAVPPVVEIESEIEINWGFWNPSRKGLRLPTANDLNGEVFLRLV